MKAEERRKRIVSHLLSAEGPVSGGELSDILGASRQIIVQDIAILRAAGHEILSTHRGYVIKSTPLVETVFKVHHNSDRTEDELSLIVELGGTVVDVFVWHKVYGKIEAKLNIFSRRGVEQYMEGIKSGRSMELMHITSGYHYHTVRADSEEALRRIESALAEKGYLLPRD